jgi:hypothetical protein
MNLYHYRILESLKYSFISLIIITLILFLIATYLSYKEIKNNNNHMNKKDMIIEAIKISLI